MDFRVKSLLITILIITISIFIFSFIYHAINKDDIDEQNRGYLNSLYTSVTIQTNVGMKGEPTKNSLKWLFIVQSFISYSVALGFAYIILNSQRN